MNTAAALTGTDAIAPPFVTPLSFLLGIGCFLLIVVAMPTAGRILAALAVRALLAARWLLTFHRAGVARVRAADAADLAARRRAREARRTVVDVDDAGRVVNITRTRTR